MLVLSRKTSEAIQIGDNIRLRVLSISRRTVKLGIEAPDGIRILRAELDQWHPSHSCGESHGPAVSRSVARPRNVRPKLATTSCR